MGRQSLAHWPNPAWARELRLSGQLRLVSFNIKSGPCTPDKCTERLFSCQMGFNRPLIVDADWLSYTWPFRWFWDFGEHSIKLTIGAFDLKIILNKVPKCPCFLTVLLQIWRHDEMGQPTQFSLPKIVTYLIFLRKIYLSSPQQVLWVLIRPLTPKSLPTPDLMQCFTCFLFTGCSEESTTACDQRVCSSAVLCSRQNSNLHIRPQCQSTTGRNYILHPSTAGYPRTSRNAGKECKSSLWEG